MEPGEALYWRAWNLHGSGRLVEARADVERARGVLYNGSLLTLAGMIELDQADYTAASRDLEEAKGMDPRNCDARGYLALAHLRNDRWADAGGEFADAARCFDASAADLAVMRDALVANEALSEAHRAQQSDAFTRQMEELSARARTAARNAADSYSRDEGSQRATRMNERAGR